MEKSFPAMDQLSCAMSYSRYIKKEISKSSFKVKVMVGNKAKEMDNSTNYLNGESKGE